MMNIFPGDICIRLDSVRSILSCAIISIFLTGNWKINIVFGGFNELFQLFIFIWDAKIQREIHLMVFSSQVLMKIFGFDIFEFIFEWVDLGLSLFEKLQKFVTFFIWCSSVRTNIWFQVFVATLLRIPIVWHNHIHNKIHPLIELFQTAITVSRKLYCIKSAIIEGNSS